MEQPPALVSGVVGGVYKLEAVRDDGCVWLVAMAVSVAAQLICELLHGLQTERVVGAAEYDAVQRPGEPLVSARPVEEVHQVVPGVVVRAVELYAQRAALGIAADECRSAGEVKVVRVQNLRMNVLFTITEYGATVVVAECGERAVHKVPFLVNSLRECHSGLAEYLQCLPRRREAAQSALVHAGGDSPRRGEHSERRSVPRGDCGERTCAARIDHADYLDRAVGGVNHVLYRAKAVGGSRVAGYYNHFDGALYARWRDILPGEAVTSARQEQGILDGKLTQIVLLALCGVSAVWHVGLVAEILEILPGKVRNAVGDFRSCLVVKAVHRQHLLEDGEASSPAVKHADGQVAEVNWITAQIGIPYGLLVIESLAGDGQQILL